MLSWLGSALGALDAQQMRRELRDSGGLINFSSNNYLGLAQDPGVIAAGARALQRYGAGAQSSRLLGGSFEIHQALETALAQWTNQEAALVFPTGYMTNLGVITALAGPGDAVILDRLCHASLVDAARLSGARLLVYRHGSAEHAERALKRAMGFRRRLLITESLFSMDGDWAPLPELLALAKRYDAISVVDEAHALGVWGEQGRGLSQGWDVVVGTLSKSLGSQGGFVSASRDLMSWLVNRARSFIYTTGLAPANAAAALEALKLAQKADDRRAHVQSLAQKLRDGLVARGFDTLTSQSQIVPLFLGDVSSALIQSDHLRAEGIFAPAIRPPTVGAGECRLRFSVTYDHTVENVESVLKAVMPLAREAVGRLTNE